MSFFLSSASLDITLRQFMLFGYFNCCFFYINYFGKDKNFTNSLIKFFEYFGNTSVVLQILYLAYVLVIEKANLFLADSYYYYSAATIFGILFFAIKKLITSKEKLLWLLFCSFLLMSTGHSSAFLSLFISILFYYLTALPKKIKIFLGGITIVFSIIIFSTINSFSDANAMWRIYYWGLTMERIIMDKFCLFGYGFGVPYADENTAYFLEVIQNFTTRLSDDEEVYLSPMHNSFITFAYHIGLVFSLILLNPLFSFLKNPRSIKNTNYQKLFLGLTLLSLSVWSFFNVVLELPHSAIIFWLVYFSYYNHFYKFSLLHKFKINK